MRGSTIRSKSHLNFGSHSTFIRCIMGEFTFERFKRNISECLLTRAVRRQKKSRQKRRLVQAPQAPFKAPIHSRCCIGGFRETGLALVIVLRCDWPLCDIWFKSYEHFKIKMFLGEASYRPRTGLVQASYRCLLQAPGKKAAPQAPQAPFFTLAP